MKEKEAILLPPWKMMTVPYSLLEEQLPRTPEVTKKMNYSKASCKKMVMTVAAGSMHSLKHTLRNPRSTCG